MHRIGGRLRGRDFGSGGVDVGLILMNINTEAAQVDLSAYEGWTMAASLSADGGEISLDAGTLNLPPFGTAILVP